jgi:hypothetical protein
MSIPPIGGIRGIFDIFVPGMFLFLNLGLVTYLLPFLDSGTRDFINASTSKDAKEVLILMIVISFSYLIGVLLRLFRTEFPDKCSAAWLRNFHPHDLWASEEFPYIGWIEEVCKQYLSPEALSFYYKIWAPRKREGQNRQFLNHCKVMINSVDERAANEFNAAEALSRYIAAMFLALVIVFPLILVTATLRYIYAGQVTVGLVIILLAYLAALVVILSFFRFARIKEVEIVFAASFKNRSIFEEKTATQPARRNWLMRKVR